MAGGACDPEILPGSNENQMLKLHCAFNRRSSLLDGLAEDDGRGNARTD